MITENAPKSLEPHEKLAEKLFAEIVGVLKDKKKPIKKTKVEFEAMKRLRIGKIFEGFLLIYEKQDIHYHKKVILQLKALLKKENLPLPQIFQRYLENPELHEEKKDQTDLGSRETADWQPKDTGANIPIWSSGYDDGDILLEEPFPGKNAGDFFDESRDYESLYLPYMDNVKGIDGAMIITNLINLLKDGTLNWRSAVTNCIKYLKDELEKDKKVVALKFIDQLEEFVKISVVKYRTLQLFLNQLGKLKASIENKKFILGTEEMESVVKAIFDEICSLSSTEIEYKKILEIIKKHLTNLNEKEKTVMLVKVLGRIQKRERDIGRDVLGDNPGIQETKENFDKMIKIIKAIITSKSHL